MKSFAQKTFFLCAAILVFSSTPVHAFTIKDKINGEAKQGSLSADIMGQYDKTASKAEIGKVDPRIAITGFIKVALTTIGSVFLALVVYAGYNLLTAGGEEDKVEKAKKTIQAAVIGLTITLAAYSITYFVGKSAHSAVTGQFDKPAQKLKWSDF